MIEEAGLAKIVGKTNINQSPETLKEYSRPRNLGRPHGVYG